jgi:hypothetical protein
MKKFSLSILPALLLGTAMAMLATVSSYAASEYDQVCRNNCAKAAAFCKQDAGKKPGSSVAKCDQQQASCLKACGF